MRHGGARIAVGVDRRVGRPAGMNADGTRVDFFQPRPVCGVCAHFDRIHRTPPPHRFAGAMHCAWTGAWTKDGSTSIESVKVSA